MVSKAKKILITTESHEIFILRMNGKSSVRGFCPQCATEAEMFTLDDAVSLTGKKTRELMCQIETRVVHSIEIASGHLLVCRNSLF